MQKYQHLTTREQNENDIGSEGQLQKHLMSSVVEDKTLKKVGVSLVLCPCDPKNPMYDFEWDLAAFLKKNLKKNNAYVTCYLDFSILERIMFWVPPKLPVPPPPLLET